MINPLTGFTARSPHITFPDFRVSKIYRRYTKILNNRQVAGFLVDWYALICIIDRVVFEWDEDKAADNLERHGVSFEEAIRIFADENAIEEFDAQHSIDEERFIRIGLSDRRVLFVVYAERGGDVIRILHARKANKRIKRLYEQTKKDNS